jgi:large subunit ribosomal protein L24
MATASHPERRPKVPEIRKGDLVVVLSGKDAGKRGEVERVIRNPVGLQRIKGIWKRVSARDEVRVVVTGVNIAKRHTKPRTRQGRNDRQPRVQQGGIVEVAQPLSASNVMLVCPNCSRPTRVAHARLESGASVRVCKHCGESVTRAETVTRGVRS